MKKYTAILLILMLPFLCKTQTPKENLIKYQYLRKRLTEDFVVADGTNRQGTYIPVASIFEYGGYLGFGENPMRSISEYMIMLATEYAINKKYDANFGLRLSLYELAGVLTALERLDINAEKFFRLEVNGLEPSDPNFWAEIDTYIEPGDLNGFFLRNDADGAPMPDKNRIFPFEEDRFLYNYNNRQLRYVDYFKNSGADDEGIEGGGVFNHEEGVTSNNRRVMSQDEVAWLFMALTMVSKLVDDDKKFTDSQGQQVTIREWCAKISFRVFEALYYKKNGINKWRIINPVNEDKIAENNGGLTYGLSWGFQQVALYLQYFSNTEEAESNIEYLENMPVYIP